MKKIISVAFILLSISLLLSCIYGTNNFLYKGNKVDSRVDYIHEIDDVLSKGKTFTEKYRILVLADVHIGGRESKHEENELLSWLDKYKKCNETDYPLFALSLGDLVDHGKQEEYEDYLNFVNKIESKGIHVINVLGNHDLFNCGWEIYKEKVYPYKSLFHFNSKNFSWYAIDTGTGDLGIKQYNLLKDAFKKDKKNKIIMMHYPLSNTRRFSFLCLHDSTERNLLIDLFAQNNVKACLCGHLHEPKDADLTVLQEYGNPSFRYSSSGWNVFEIDEINGSVKKLPLDSIIK